MIELTWVTYWALVVATMATTYKVSDIVDQNLNDQARSDAAQGIRNLFGKKLWGIKEFSLLFDKAFSRDDGSISLIRSSVVSVIVAVAAIVVIWPKELLVDNEVMSVIVIFPIMLNVVPDYLSLVETRWIMKRLGPAQNISKLLGYLSLDIILTALIFIGFPLLVGLMAILVVVFIPEALAVESIENNKSSLDIPYLALSPFFLTTYTTSMWLWFFVISRFISSLLSRLNFVSEWLEIDLRPIRSLGLLTSCVILVFALPMFALLKLLL